MQPLPGAVRLVQHLRRHGVPIAVATGSQRRNYAQKSAHLVDTLFGAFEGRVVCADDGLIRPGRGKPHPDIFLVTAEKCCGRTVGLGEQEESTVTEEERRERAKGLVFEDAIPGVQAGKRAGMNGAWSFYYMKLGRRATAGLSVDFSRPFSCMGPRRQPPCLGGLRSNFGTGPTRSNLEISRRFCA